MISRLLLAGLLFTTPGFISSAPPQQDHNKCVICAPAKQNAPGEKGCACPASKGDTCDADGNRTTHTMKGCVNGADCKRHCCKCCPRD